ncbi:MAG TPA: isoprenylcysteine carboxylmethyltransferase family protein [Solirubrobacteraceae bacterium]|jgi:protein-S-isoprenylcysteine O-methyltransferase Ste14
MPGSTVRPLPYTDAGAKLVFYIVLIVFLLLEWSIRLRSRSHRQGARIEDTSIVAVFGLVIAGFVVAFLCASKARSAAIPDGRWPIFIVGIAFMAAGTALRQWAVLTLGRFFTVDVRVQSDQTVVEGGPYRWVRHPSYSGMVVVFVGVGFALGNWGSLVALVVLPTIGLLIRIRVEERMLLAQLGDPYRRFAESRARLFPGIW